MSNTAFFDAVRDTVFGGSLSQDQVDGINTIMRAWQSLGDGDDRKLAYILATAFHETARTMQPVRETLAKNNQQAIRRLDHAWKNGQLKWVKKPYWRDGWFGRGYVQLTHKANYKKAGRKLGIDLVSDPSQALQPTVAAHILIRGMLEGWFTTKKLGRYITDERADYINARWVVNGTDRAVTIADIAVRFEMALGLIEEPNTPAPKPTPKPRPNLLARILGWLLGFFTKGSNQ